MKMYTTTDFNWLFCYLRNVYLFLPIIVQVPHLLRLRFNQSCRYSIRPSSFYVHTHTHINAGCVLLFSLSLLFFHSFHTEAILCVPHSKKLSEYRSVSGSLCVFVFSESFSRMRTNEYD